MTLAKHRGVEIGATFLRPDVRASSVNPETKRLMLSHAFNSGAVRVQFKVDIRNERSQAAVAKLGAVKEGVLRHDMRTWALFRPHAMSDLCPGSADHSEYGFTSYFSAFSQAP